jgi:ATP-dependent DNA helicase Q5
MAASIDDLAGFAKSCLGDDEELGAPSGSSGIVFCRTKVETDSLCIELNKRGVITRAYHAGLEVLFLLLSDIFCSYLLYQEVERVHVQELWMAGTVPVITATVSFGMGVDRGPVRFVAHWSVPACISSYYQESGRAGRDGKLSYARLYYSYSDRDMLSSLMRREVERAEGNRKEELKARHTSFKILIKYAESASSCRHAIFSCYFGDHVTDCEDACNVCVNPDSAVERLRDYQSGLMFEPNQDEETLAASKAKREFNNLISRKFRM